MNAKPPSLADLAFGDLDRELRVTRTVLERLPDDQYSWKPHEKSMSLGQLALHVAELPTWMRVTLGQDELDAASAPRPPANVSGRDELLSRFDQNAAALRQTLADFDVAKLNQPWSMRNGPQVMVTRPKWTVYRIWCINHLIHHRAQLCVYLRMLNVPVPAVYFNSADEPDWKFE